MPKRILDDFLLRQNNYSNFSLPGAPTSIAVVFLMGAGILRTDRAADSVLPWWWIPILLFCALIVLIGSYYLLRYAGFVLSVRLKSEGVQLSRELGHLELVPWAQVKEVRGSSLSREVLLDKLTILFADGSKCPLEYPILEDHQHRWLLETARTIPVSVPIFPRDSPVARAHAVAERGPSPSASAPAWILRLFLRGEALMGLALMLFATILMSFVIWHKWDASATLIILGSLFLVNPLLSASFALYAFLGARYRTLLFFGASRVARIAPEGTSILKAPYAGFRAWRPALLGRQGEVLPLTICGLGLSREQLLRIADALPEDDAAHEDIERYLSISAVWQPIFVRATLLLCAGIYALAIAIFCDAWWVAIGGAVPAVLGLLAFAQRFRAIYRIGRERVSDFRA